jgi:hypothetical protein
MIFVESKNNFFFTFALVVCCLTMVFFDDLRSNSNFFLKRTNQAIDPLKFKDDVMSKSDIIIRSLKFKNFSLLKEYVHPKKGLRFSPYSYVVSSDLVFQAQELMKLGTDVKSYDWGYKKSNKKIQTSFEDYFNYYVYNFDFANADQVLYNEVLFKGSIVDNTREFYGDSIIVEYNIDSVGQVFSMGRDWAKLRLIFEKFGAEWFLSGIINIRGA